MSQWGQTRKIDGVIFLAGVESEPFQAAPAGAKVDRVLAINRDDAVTDAQLVEITDRVRQEFVGKPYSRWLEQQSNDPMASLSPHQIAVEALREVAQSGLLLEGGILPPLRECDLSLRAVVFALEQLGEIETIEKHESLTGTRQVVWQGRRLRNHDRPSLFRLAG